MVVSAQEVTEINVLSDGFGIQSVNAVCEKRLAKLTKNGMESPADVSKVTF